MIQRINPKHELTHDGRPRAPKVSWRRTTIRIGVSALTLAGLFVLLPRDELWSALRRVPLTTWFAAVAAYLSLHLLGVVKWRLTVNLTGAELGLAQAARCYYGGLFGNIFLPSVVGGDVVRAGLAFGQTRSRTGLVIGSLLDRLIDMAGLVVLAGVGALLLEDQFEMLGKNVLLPLGAAGLAAVVFFGVVGFLGPVRRLPFRVRRRVVKLRQAIRPIYRRPQFILASLVLGVSLQGGLIVLNAWLGQACGLECSLAVWFFVWPLAKLSAVLPVTQGGIGVREAALAALFAMFDVSAALAVAVGLVFETIIITGGLIGGPIAVGLGRLPRPEGIAGLGNAEACGGEACKTC